jgi:hypothetical protein
MMIPVTTLAFVMQLTVAIADNVPHFKLEPVCHGIAQQGGLDLEPNQSVRQNFASCMKSETAVRDQLVKQWPTFKASDRANCVGESNAGGMLSYTDLLTCLQMARDVSKISQ